MSNAIKLSRSGSTDQFLTESQLSELFTVNGKPTATINSDFINTSGYIISGTTITQLKNLPFFYSFVNSAYFCIIDTDVTYNGGNYSITLSGLLRGLFSLIGGTISNLTIYSSDTSTVQDSTGILCKSNAYGIITGCTMDLPFIVSAREGGGVIVGELSGSNGKSISISNCTVKTKIGYYSSGICGRNSGIYGGSVTITNCYCEINFNSSYCNGIIGDYAGAYSGSCTISDCTIKRIPNGYPNGSNICGDYAGSYGGSITITNCSVSGTLANGVNFEFGICRNYAGSNGGSCTIINCHNTLSYADLYFSAGICGDFAGSSSGFCLISNCSMSGDMFGSCSGICGNDAGITNGRCEIRNCYFTGNCIAINSLGICGNRPGKGGNCLISECYTTGNASKICGDDAGREGYCLISECYTTGNTSPICGNNPGRDLGKCEIIKCYTTGIMTTYSSGICGDNAGTNGYCLIQDCYSTGSMSSECSGICRDYAGSSSGYCIIRNCYSTASMSSYCSGICKNYAGSSNGYCLISQCYWRSSIEGKNTFQRSIPGYSYGICGNYAASTSGLCEIIDCYSEGTGIDYDGSGICGNYSADTNGKCRIIRCSSKMDTQSNYASGIIGRYSGNNRGYCLVKDCYNFSNQKESYTGGICGERAANSSGYLIIQNCRTEGTIQNTYSGGIVGGNYIGNNGIIEILNCSSSKHMLGSNWYCGGIIGGYDIYNTRIINCSYTGNMYLNRITSNDNKYYCAGIIGGWIGSSAHYITNCYASCGLTVSGYITLSGYNMTPNAYYVGGIATYYFRGRISNCFYLGPIYGSEAGGICASYASSSNGFKTIIENCYTIGDISERCGGIVGPYASQNNTSGYILIHNCYSTGNLLGDAGSILGNFSGNISANVFVFNCYGNGQLTPSGYYYEYYNYFTNIKSDGSLDPNNVYRYSKNTSGLDIIPVLSLANITNKLIITDQMNKYINVREFGFEIKNWADAWTTPSSDPTDGDTYPRLKQFLIKPWAQSANPYYNTTAYTAYNRPPTLDYYLYNDTRISVTLSGSIIDTGLENPYERGFTFSINRNPNGQYPLRTSEIGSFGISNFTHTLEGLYPDTTYYVRSYATNSFGSGYGTEITVTTSGYLPVVDLRSFIYTNPTVGLGLATIYSTGGSPVTDFGYVWSRLPNPSVDLPDTYELHIPNMSGYSLGDITTTVSGLNIDYDYYISAFAKNSIGIAYSSPLLIQKPTTYLPQLTTLPVSTVADIFARTGLYLISNGGIPVTRVGIAWSTSSSTPTRDLITKNEIVGFYNSGSSIPITASGLVVNTKYYIRAYAVNANGTTYGSTFEFTTLQVTPFITVAPITDILQYSARITATITDLGGTPINTRGVVWSKFPTPVRNGLDTFKIEETGLFSIGTISYVISMLDHNTVYYVRTYAINSTGTTYGTEQVFTTLTNTVPTPSLSPPSYITTSSVIATGSIARVGAYNTVFERGIVWGLSSDVNINTTIGIYKESVPTQTDLFQSNIFAPFYYIISDLIPATTYYIRSYAINTFGIAYSDSAAFSTLALGPDVTTDSIISFNGNSVTVGGTIISTGGSNATSVGIIWSTLPSPTIDLDTKTTVSGSYSAGPFSVTAYGLTPNTTYYVRAFATNVVGTAYGSDLTVTTGFTPGIETSMYSITTSGFGTFTGTLINTGGYTVTELGFVWNTSGFPTTTSNLGILTITSSSGHSVGSYSLSTSGFDTNISYHIRSYAINSQGISYGNNVQTKPGIYPFDRHMFTNANSTGRTGPILTQIQSAYSYLPWASNTSILNMTTQGIQLWTVPVTGSYTIVAAGAGSGSANSYGGRGAVIQSTQTLSRGTVLKILVGQKGSIFQSSGGGGGSFVLLNDNTPLLIAGGGGGSLSSNMVQPFDIDKNVDTTLSRLSDASIIITANNSSDGSGTGGTNGNGGTGSLTGYGGGGGGLLTNGTNNITNANVFGSSFLNGGLGGNSDSYNAIGGFGGGAGTYGINSGGGGGGGYSGGGGSGIKGVNLDNLAQYLRNFMSEFRNPNFYFYNLDGDGFYISDGGSDMYDSGNATNPWLLSGTQYTGTNIFVSLNFTANYENTMSTVVDSNWTYISLGYSNPDRHPLTVIGTRSGVGSPIGWQVSGNSGADGSGSLEYGMLYENVIINGYTVYALYRCQYATSDPSHCDLYILLGNPKWESEFGTVYNFVDTNKGGNGAYLYTSGSNVKNIIAIKTLLSKSNGVLVTADECKNVIQAFIRRIDESNFVSFASENTYGGGGASYSANDLSLVGYNESHGFVSIQLNDNISVYNTIRMSILSITYSSSSATISSILASKGYTSVTNIGAAWSITNKFPSLTIDNYTSLSGTYTEGNYNINVFELLPETTYYLRVYARSYNTISYSDVVTFTTNPGLPVLDKLSLSSIGVTTVNASSNVLSIGGSTQTLIERGFVYSLTSDPLPSISDTKVIVSGTSTGPYSTTISGLIMNTRYHVRAYAINSSGVGYSNNYISFDTRSTVDGNVITVSTQYNTRDSFIATGNITSSGTSPLLTRGFVCSTTSQPTISTSDVIIINETSQSGFSIGPYTLRGTFSLPVYGTYYIRSYIIDSNNLERYGAQLSFVRIPNKPTIITPNPVASSITGVSADLSITISNTGGSNVTRFGFVWNTSPNPTLENSPQYNLTGSFSATTYSTNVSGFTHNTTYYVRAYGGNLAGISYGNDVTFTTTSGSPPTVITAGFTPLQNQNTSGLTVSGFSVVTGNILSTGGTVTRRGVVWGLTSQPTVSSNLGIVEVPFPGGTTDYTGEFDATLSPLNTTISSSGYYIRAFAESAAGIGYGNQEYISCEYYFRTHTFTSCGATGRSGPTLSQIRSDYFSKGALWVYDARKENSSQYYLSMDDTIGKQMWYPPHTGIYLVTAAGAGGGGATMLGGRGRILTSALYLYRENKYYIVVGQPGTTYFNVNSGGGGGSYISLYSQIPLLVAGGGGGFNRSANLSSAYPTSDANLLTYGFDSFDGLGKGGYNGEGGGAASVNNNTSNNGSGGGGFYTDGIRSFRAQEYSRTSYGTSFINGSYGGTAYSLSDGGFGGGGAALSLYGTSNPDGGGGGGGYSGGGGSGASANNNPAGGGGSYSVSLVTSSGYNIYQNTSGLYVTDGYVIIQPVITGANAVRSIFIKSVNSSSGFYTVTANVGGLAGQYGYQRGFVYSTTNTAPTLQDESCIETGFFGSGYFTTTTPVNLMPGTKYYIRAFMITTNVTTYDYNDRAKGEGKKTATVYSTSLEYTTPNGIPSISTDPQPLNISINSCELTANLLATGGSIVTERGFVWATINDDLTIENYTWLYRETSVSGFDLGNFTAAISSLGSGEETYPTMNPNTTYYIRAFAANSSGYSYSPTISFKTESVITPTIINYDLSYKSSTSAVTGFSVTDTSGSEIFERGIVYSLTNPNPTIE